MIGVSLQEEKHYSELSKLLRAAALLEVSQNRGLPRLDHRVELTAEFLSTGKDARE